VICLVHVARASRLAISESGCCFRHPSVSLRSSAEGDRVTFNERAESQTGHLGEPPRESCVSESPRVPRHRRPEERGGDLDARVLRGGPRTIDNTNCSQNGQTDGRFQMSLDKWGVSSVPMNFVAICARFANRMCHECLLYICLIQDHLLSVENISYQWKNARLFILFILFSMWSSSSYFCNVRFGVFIDFTSNCSQQTFGIILATL